MLGKSEANIVSLQWRFLFSGDGLPWDPIRKTSPQKQTNAIKRTFSSEELPGWCFVLTEPRQKPRSTFSR